MLKTLEDIILMVRERKTKPQSESYTNKLLANKELSVEKVKEEVQEEQKSENKVTTTEVVVEEVKEESDGLSPLMSRYINASSKLEKDAF